MPLARFVEALRAQSPPARRCATFDVGDDIVPARFERSRFARARRSKRRPCASLPDLAGLRRLACANSSILRDRRFGYPYINCTNCGPRYSIVLGLPYDRPRTMMRDWPMCAPCRAEYEDPADRRFHAQPVACPACGPSVLLRHGDDVAESAAAIERTAELLAGGAIVAIKGIGGYHLACDARNANAVAALRERKYRKERPFAVMARDLSSGANAGRSRRWNRKP